MLKPTTANKQQGLSIIEVMVSIAIVAIAITALVTISNASINSVNSSRDQAIADQYARQGIEITRAVRDQTTWDKFIKNNGNGGGTGAPGEQRIYSLKDPSVGSFTQVGSVSTADAYSTPCAYIQSDTTNYNITGNTRFRRAIVVKVVTIGSGTEAQVLSSVCYSYAGSNYKKVEVRTILSSWK